MVTKKQRAPAHTKARRRRTTRQWKAPIDIHNLAVDLAIDGEIKRTKLQSRWQVSQAIAFARCSLAIAINDAGDYESFDGGKELSYWTAVADLADRADFALQNLVRQIGDRIPDTDSLVQSVRVPVTIAKSGKIKVSMLPKGHWHGQSKEDFISLCNAKEALTGFAERCRLRRRDLAARRKNIGDPAKRIFVFRLAQGWIFLTGKRPGRTFLVERNPFLRFVGAAWRDAGFDDDKEDFSSALDAALKTFRGYEGWSWSKQSRETVSGLSTYGPNWLD